MKKLVLLLLFIAVSVTAAITDISPLGKVRTKDSSAQKNTAAVTKKSAISPKAIYAKSCFACHGTGAAGAPKLDDSAAWSSRLAQGMNVLVKNAINGKGAMPPKGGAMTLSNADIEAVVKYMVSKSK